MNRALSTAVDVNLEHLVEKAGISPVASEKDVERPLPDWHYGYMAGVVDHRSNLVITVGKDSARRVGYRIAVECRIKTERQRAVGFLNSFFSKHELSVREITHDDQTYTSYEFVLGRRNVIVEFLTLVQPYVSGHQDSIVLLCDYIIPALEAGAHQKKESFLELMAAIEEFREIAGRDNRAKYDYAYFVEEWEMTAETASSDS